MCLGKKETVKTKAVSFFILLTICCALFYNILRQLVDSSLTSDSEQSSITLTIYPAIRKIRVARVRHPEVSTPSGLLREK